MPTGHVAILVQLVGFAIVIFALVDVFATVLLARTNTSIFSQYLFRATWQLFRLLAKLIPLRSATILGLAGPVALVWMATAWILMLLNGFALIFWPMMGPSVQASPPAPTPTGYTAALYYSGGCLTTAGSGTLAPVSPFARIVTVIEMCGGICVITVTLTYLVQIYNALLHRNAMALSLHHATANTGDAAHLVSRLGAHGDFTNAATELSRLGDRVAEVYEGYHFYPSLLYFRFQDPEYAVARVAFLLMETVTLFKTALDHESYKQIIDGSSADQLWCGGRRVLNNLSRAYLPHGGPQHEPHPDAETASLWTRRFHAAVTQLQACNIRVTPDLDAGARRYVALRREWNLYVQEFAKYMNLPWKEVAPADPD